MINNYILQAKLVRKQVTIFAKLDHMSIMSPKSKKSQTPYNHIH